MIGKGYSFGMLYGMVWQGNRMWYVDSDSDSDSDWDLGSYSTLPLNPLLHSHSGGHGCKRDDYRGPTLSYLTDTIWYLSQCGLGVVYLCLCASLSVCALDDVRCATERWLFFFGR